MTKVDSLKTNYRFQKRFTEWERLSPMEKQALKRVYMACEFPIYFNTRLAFNEGAIFLRYIRNPFAPEYCYLCAVGFDIDKVITIHVSSGLITYYEKEQFNENCL